jgi:hypothetical protein
MNKHCIPPIWKQNVSRSSPVRDCWLPAFADARVQAMESARTLEHKNPLCPHRQGEVSEHLEKIRHRGCCNRDGRDGLCARARQSTDGFHSIQIFPVVVDSAAFTQRFTFTNPDPDRAAVIAVRYFPGVGTSQAAPLDCPNITVVKASGLEFNSLRELCPGLAAGSQFGYLYTHEINAGNRMYAAFSRVSNPSANGFSVEAFPAHTFTSPMWSSPDFAAWRRARATRLSRPTAFSANWRTYLVRPAARPAWISPCATAPAPRSVPASSTSPRDA